MSIRSINTLFLQIHKYKVTIKGIVASGLTSNFAVKMVCRDQVLLADKLDSMGLNRDINAVIGTGAPNAVRRKIELVMGDDAPEFLRRAGVEEEFTKTKRAVTGNSTTELQKQIGESFDQMIDPGFLNDIANSNRSNIVGNVIKVLSARKPTPEIVEQLGEMMFKQGYTDRQIRNILGGNGVKRALGDDYDRIIAPFVSGAAPITGAISSDQNI